MGLFHEYIRQGIQGQQVEDARKEQLRRIEQLRGSRVLTYASRIASLPVQVDIGIVYEDILPFADSLEGLTGERVSVVLETPGGVGEVGRQMVEMLHERFRWVEFIVPGTAMSTGTIMCLGAHEILMGAASSLGPIDAQLSQDGKRYSADALLEGFNAIKAEVDSSGGKLNPAYIPILQRLSPGELQNAANALEFARATVTDWLAKYKFANWNREGVPVDEETKKLRAREIAHSLSSQSNWHTHGRSLRIADLEALKLKIIDFGQDVALNDAIMRYHVLVRMTLEGTNAYKLYETADSSILRRFQVEVNPQQLAGILGGLQNQQSLRVDMTCQKCGERRTMQIDFAPNQPLEPGVLRFPNRSKGECPKCRAPIDYSRIRADIEQRMGRPALTPQPEA